MKTAQPEQLAEMKEDKLIDLWEQTLNGIDEALAQKEAIKLELESRLQKIGEKSKEWNGYIVTRYPKTYFNNVSLETAKQFAATQMTEPKEVINTTILKRLIEAGKEVPGAETRMETRIVPITRKEGDEA